MIFEFRGYIVTSHTEYFIFDRVQFEHLINHYHVPYDKPAYPIKTLNLNYSSESKLNMTASWATCLNVMHSLKYCIPMFGRYTPLYFIASRITNVNFPTSTVSALPTASVPGLLNFSLVTTPYKIVGYQ